MKPWTNSLWGWIAGLVGLAVGSMALLAQVSKHVGLPDRVQHVENSARVLAEGQIELGRRVDVMGNDLSSLRREVEAGSRRNEGSFSEVMKQLAQISGTLGDVRDSARDNQRDVTALREKVVNALTVADEALHTAQEAKIKGTDSK